MHAKLTIKPYVVGFVLSIILTLAAYYPVWLHVQTHHLFPTHEMIIPLILVFAFAQLFVQLFFFLHMGREQKPRYNLAVFITFFGMVLLVILASVWIMTHLNYNMTPTQMENQIMSGEHLQLDGKTKDDGRGHMLMQQPK